MLNPRNLILVVTSIVLTSCTDGSTTAPNLDDPKKPALIRSGGGTVDPTSTTTVISTETTVDYRTTADNSPETTASDSTSVNRGGHMLGSGG